MTVWECEQGWVVSGWFWLVLLITTLGLSALLFFQTRRWQRLLHDMSKQHNQ